MVTCGGWRTFSTRHQHAAMNHHVFTSHWRAHEYVSHTHTYAKQFPYAFDAIILNLIMYPHSLMLQIHTFDTFQKRALSQHRAVLYMQSSLYSKRFILATSVWNNLFSNKIKQWKKKRIFNWNEHQAKCLH